MSTSVESVQPAASRIDDVLIDCPNDFVHDRVARALVAGGATLERCGRGLRMPCGGIDYKRIFHDAAETLSSSELHDVRVAVVGGDDSPDRRFEAIFSCRRMDEFLQRLSAEWLLAALRDNELVVHFHPVIQQPPGRLHGHECLARSIDEVGAFLPPARLFEAARTLDLLPTLDEKCRLTAIARAAELKLKTTQLFINFHPAAIYHAPNCFAATFAAVEREGLSPGLITFEAKASDRMVDRQHLAETLRHCRSHGFKIALDSVGVGYPALLAMEDLRPDYLKLEGDLVRQAAQSEPAARVIRELTEAARQRGIIVVAGGIETEQELRFVLGLGIRMTQGFFHARPQPQVADNRDTRDMLRRAKKAYAGNAAAAPQRSAGKGWDVCNLYENLARAVGPLNNKP